MIWGQTRAQRLLDQQREHPWVKWFAWRPVQLLCGRWAWLQTLEKQRHFVHALEWSHWTTNYREPTP